MYEETQILRALEDIFSRLYPYRDRRAAMTGKRNADGTINPNPTDGAPPGFIWVREGVDGERGQTLAFIVNIRDDVADVPVWIGEAAAGDGLYAIEPRIDARSLSVYGASLAGFGVPRQAAALNTQLTDSLNITEGRVKPADIGGLNVTVEGFWLNNSYKPPTTVDVSANVPGTSGQSRWVVVYYTPATDTFTAASGTASTLPATGFLEADIAEIAVPAGSIPLGALILTHGDSEVTASNFRAGIDRRLWLNGVQPLNNWGASAAPTVNDDSADGYSVGSLWFDTTNDKLYWCSSASAGAADWELVGSSTLTTKGDLLTRTSSAEARLGVGADGEVLTADSGETTGLKWAAVSGGGTTTQVIDVPQAFLVGFEFDYDGTTFTVQPGTCRNDDDTYTITKTSTTTINTGSTGAGALDTGSLASNTWYYLWVIAKSSDGTTSAILSTSSTAPTMPSGYDKKRRVGSVKTQSSSATLLRVWTERGAGTNRKFIYTDDFTLHRNDAAVTIASAGTYYTCTVTHAPPTCLNVGLTFYASGGVRAYIRPLALASTNGGFDLSITNSTSYADLDNVPINSSQQFTVTRSGGSSVTFSYVTRWYQDTLIPTIVGSSSADTVQSASTTTTNNTATTLATIATATDIAYTVEATVTARRTGGSSGTAGDGASYKIIGSFKNSGGTLTQRGSTTNVMTVEDQAGWDAAFDISGTDIRIRVTGATNNNISWTASYTVTDT